MGNTNGGIGFFGLLAILFIGLKLTAVLDWSWWWVLAPLWGPFTAVMVVLAAIFIGAIAMAFFDECGARKSR